MYLHQFILHSVLVFAFLYDFQEKMRNVQVTNNLYIYRVFAKISALTNQVNLHSNFKYMLLQDATICHTVAGLTKAQMEICYRQPDTTTAALEGLQHAIQECQHQFHGHRWNCSSLATRARVPYTSAMFQRG